MWVLGINEAHNSTAALLHDGEIIGCISEERLTGIKNYCGYPKKSIEVLLSKNEIGPEDLDLVVYSYSDGTLGHFSSAVVNPLGSWADPLHSVADAFRYYLPPATLLSRAWLWCIRGSKSRSLDKMKKEMVSRHLGIPTSKVTSADHHTCHAYTAAFGCPSSFRSKKLLVATLDGEGDGICATVNVCDGLNLKRVAHTPREHSIGLLYMYVTRHLGLKGLEDEYKVMGLAPYADTRKAYPLLSDFKRLVSLNKNGLTFTSKFVADRAAGYLKRNAVGIRFDAIAQAVQRLTEELVSAWIKSSLKYTETDVLSMSGGVFMNVKLNLVIMEMEEVKDLFPFPSAGDESNAIGAAYYGYRLLCEENGIKFDPKPLKHVYLGPEYSEDDIVDALKFYDAFSRYKVEKYEDIEGMIAELISKGKIVARFSDKMEWGARALGNRSILADPSNLLNIRELNKRIKSRDFWMPFAPTILYERQYDYIINPKNVEAPYMTLAFRSTERARKELVAAMHQYDYTLRPQVLRKEHNPKYYRLVKEFEDITGIGGVLNTSFNLHGKPIVCSPRDALWTFQNSGLQYLALGNILVSKV